MRTTTTKSRRKRWRWVIPLLVLLALAAAIRTVALYRPFDSPATADGRPGSPDAAGTEDQPYALPGDLQTFLVMGVDSREGEWGRSDSMVVASYKPREQRVAILSIPRDLWTYIPGHGYDKINHAYAFGGPALSVETVERLLGLDIDHWVSIDFDGFVKVIDALGGVEVNPPKPLYYVDPADRRSGEGGLVIDIKPGPQVMDGETALKYARFRNDPEGDVGRMRRQQEIIQAAMKKAASPAIFARASQLIPALYETIGTDMTVGEMVKLAATGRQALTKPPVTGTIEGDEYLIDGIFYFGADLVELRTAAYELLVGEPPGEDFLARARADNEQYQAALQEALARSQAAAAAQDEEPAAEEEADEGADEAGTGGEAAEQPGGDAEGGTTAEEPGAPGEAGSSAYWASVYLVDATGQGDRAQLYAESLRAAGLEVSRVQVSAAQLSVTMALVRNPELDVDAVRERLASVLPDVIVRMAPDPTASDDIDLVLGTNALDN